MMHGGGIMAYADTMGAIATMANLAEGQTTTTIESKTNFFAASPAGTVLVAESVPLHRGRRTQVWETRLTHKETGRLAACRTYPIFSVFSTIYRNDYGKPLIYSRPPLESSM